MRKETCSCPGKGHFGRRDFLRVGSLSFLGISLSQYLELKEVMATTGQTAKHPKAQACILLWLGGGPSHVDTWDPKPNSGFKPISTNVPGMQISELLPRVAKHMDQLAIIRSMHHMEGNHSEGTHYAVTGHRPSPAMQFPSVGSIITKEMGPRNHVPAYVQMPNLDDRDQYFQAHFLGAEYDPLVLPDPSKKNFSLPDLSLPASVSVAAIEDRRSFLRIVDRSFREKIELGEFSSLDTFREKAWNMILSPAVREAFDLSKESEKTKENYGRTGVGQSLLLARRLVEAGSRFVTAGMDGWDTHGDNDKRLREDLAPSLDHCLSTLLEDLTQRGLLDSTIVIVMGEFGRTPHVNPGGGRDHWPNCWSLALGGGGLRGGQVVGASDERGAFVAERRVSVGDVFATIYKAFGIDWKKEYMHPIGRPLKIANSLDDVTGTPLPELS